MCIRDRLHTSQLIVTPRYSPRAVLLLYTLLVFISGKGIREIHSIQKPARYRETRIIRQRTSWSECSSHLVTIQGRYAQYDGGFVERLILPRSFHRRNVRCFYSTRGLENQPGESSEWACSTKSVPPRFSTHISDVTEKKR